MLKIISLALEDKKVSGWTSCHLGCVCGMRLHVVKTVRRLRYQHIFSCKIRFINKNNNNTFDQD